MKFLGQKAGAVEGKWFPYTRTQDEVVGFLVRGVSAAEYRTLENKLLGRKRPVHVKKGKLIVDVDEKLEFAQAHAGLALMDSKNADIEVHAGHDLTALSAALGREVKVGDTVRMDGHWTESAKRTILGEPEAGLLVEWAIARSNEQDIRPDDDAEEEAELGKT